MANVITDLNFQVTFATKTPLSKQILHKDKAMFHWNTKNVKSKSKKLDEHELGISQALHKIKMNSDLKV